MACGAGDRVDQEALIEGGRELRGRVEEEYSRRCCSRSWMARMPWSTPSGHRPRWRPSGRGGLLLIEVRADQEARWERMSQRGRSGDPSTRRCSSGRRRPRPARRTRRAGPGCHCGDGGRHHRQRRDSGGTGEEARGSVVGPVSDAVVQTDSDDTSPNIAFRRLVTSSSHEHCDRLAEEHPQGA